MSTLVIIATTLLAFVVVSLAGLPLVGRAVDRQLRRRDFAAVDGATRRPPIIPTTTLTPIDLGPVTLTWPSMNDLGKPFEDTLAWPSTTWDDEFFGQHDSVRLADEARARAEARRAAATGASRAAAVAPPAAAKARAKARAKTRPVGPPVALKARRVEPPAPAPAAPDDVALAGIYPSSEDVMAIVAEHGLQGAVRVLISERGLGLDDATQVLLRARRSKR